MTQRLPNLRHTACVPESANIRFELGEYNKSDQSQPRSSRDRRLLCRTPIVAVDHSSPYCELPITAESELMSEIFEFERCTHIVEWRSAGDREEQFRQTRATQRITVCRELPSEQVGIGCASADAKNSHGV